MFTKYPHYTHSDFVHVSAYSIYRPSSLQCSDQTTYVANTFSILYITLKVVILSIILRHFSQILKVATNETSTLNLTLSTWIALEIYSSNGQQYNRHTLQ